VTRQPKTARGKAIVDAAREMADAAERAAVSYEHGSALGRAQGDSDAADARAELERLVAEWEVQSGPAFEAAALSGADSIALLIRSLHERAQQAELTRDAAQARATACEERARRAEQQAADAAGLLVAAERQLAEWRACAEEGSRLVEYSGHIDKHWHESPSLMDIKTWSDAVLARGIDPSAGTGDHELEPGRMGE